MLTLFFLAEQLKMSVIEIMRMPAIEVTYWSAYFEVQRRESEKATKPNHGPKPY